MSLGDCFEVHAKHLHLMSFNDPEKLKTMVLVHGVPTGTGNGIEGLEYAHCWIEENEMMVIDISNGADHYVPIPLYYGVGNIDEKRTKKYTYPEMKKWLHETEIYGPWELNTVR
jgi:hypothetical protein